MKIKLIVGTALVLFTIIIASVGSAALIISEEKKGKPSTKLASLDFIDSAAGLTQSEAELGGIAFAEISGHDSSDDCWMILEGSVYDFTSFLDGHPGGAESMVSYCGQDGSVAFITKDVTPPSDHTAFARELLGQYYLGKVASSDLAALPDVNVSPGVKLITITPTIPIATIPPSQQSADLTLSIQEVAKHNSTQDCWIIVSSNVFNVSSYLFAHPGGAETIIPYCGGEATNAFATKDKSNAKDHTSSAYSLLNNYLIGTIGSPIAQIPPTQQPPPPPTPTAIPPTPTPPTTTPPPPPNILTLTLEQIASHNTLQDCWLIVSEYVYEVTSYIDDHPGSTDDILYYCGTDGTVGFQTKDKVNAKDHTAFAYNLLADFLIGKVGDDVVIAPPPTDTPTPTPKPTKPPDENLEEKLTEVPGSILAVYPGATLKKGKRKADGKYDVEIITAGGECRKIKLDINQVITSDKKC